MKSITRLFLKLTLLFTIVYPFRVFPQGCSDAGFCSIGDLSVQKKDSSDRGHKLTFSLPVGKGDESVFILTPSLQYDLALSHAWAAQLKVTANYADGNLGTASGAGDVYVSGIYAWSADPELKLSFTLGSKLPLNSGNLKSDGRPLPMQYQSSLGTVDVIAGVTAVINNAWQLSAGWQQPLSGRNSNRFLPAYWNSAEAQRYPPSNELERRGDLLLRLSYSLLAGEKIAVNGGLLGIYHLGDDTYIDSNNNATRIAGSEGLTLNLTTAFTWKVNANLTLGFSAGAPVITRDVRPDGLTRSFVFVPEIQWAF